MQSKDMQEQTTTATSTKKQVKVPGNRNATFPSNRNIKTKQHTLITANIQPAAVPVSPFCIHLPFAMFFWVLGESHSKQTYTI